jgi:rfaE bifunctional protein nucleotidyltransferase chain/domain
VLVLANGCFDPFHYGHLLHLQAARKLGDVLVVAVTKDEFVNKGPRRPAFKLHERMAVIKALAIVDEVIATESGEDAINKVKPDIFVKGPDYAGKLQKELRDLVESYGGRVVYTDDPKYSSSQLIAEGHFTLESIGSG